MTQYQHRPDQGGGGSEKQFILYLFFAFAMVLLFQGVFFHPAKNQKAAPAPAPAQQPAPAATQAATPASAARAVSPAPAANKPVVAKQASAENEIVVENSLYKVTFTNRGAQIKSWILKKFKDDHGRPLDLVNNLAAAQAGLPLSFFTYDQNLRQQLNSALYVATPGAHNAASGTDQHLDAPASLTFDYAEGNLEVRKSFSFDHSYVVKVETSVTQNGAPVQAYPAWPSAFGDQSDQFAFAAGNLDWQTPEGVKHQPAFDHSFIHASTWVADGATLRDTFNWAGVTDEYFAALWMPSLPQDAAAVTFNQSLEIPKNPGDAKDKTTEKVQALGIAVGNVNGATSENLFVGPKAVDVLNNIHSASSSGASAQGPDLGGVIDFGFFGFFAKWLFLWLNWTHDHWIPNWGWAIIILTAVINAVFLPMRLSQMKTSLKMQKAQPRIQDINKKYEKYGLRDTEKQQQKQQEVMAIYKEEGINPVAMGGCLFMVVQLPLIWAFYAVLRNSIELRQAPWLWIRDLSAPDPLHILPILTILVMYVVQSMTPMPGMDATQRRFMNISMIAVFGYVTLRYSAGLALYLIVSYGISLAQQYFLNRSELGREIRDIQAKRARKKMGKGK